MNGFNGTWKSSDGIDFFVRGWQPETKPKAVVGLIHGLGEHSGRYEHVAEALTGAAYVVAGFDLRGHGKSTGIRGHFPSLDAVMQDIQDFFVFLSQRYPYLPQFIYGHSLGGLLTLTYVLKSKPSFKGAIAASSGLRTPLTEQKFKILMARLLGSFLPTTLIPSGLETEVISHDQNVIERYDNDPLVHDRVSLALTRAGLAALDYVWGHGQELSLPLLLMHGTADRATYSHGSSDFSRLVAGNNADVTLKLWDGMYHELHNEPVKEEVLQFIIDWLDRHL